MRNFQRCGSAKIAHTRAHTPKNAICGDTLFGFGGFCANKMGGTAKKEPTKTSVGSAKVTRTRARLHAKHAL